VTKYICTFALFCLSTFPPASVASGARVSSSAGACRVLTRVALGKHLALGTSKGEYHCSADSANGKYFVLGLHYWFHAPKGWAGSNLVGWYAVRKWDGHVYEWNMATEELGDPVDSP
jgi:hypothetical protein